ncbi:hypothetical protein [Streptomyces sp. SID161]|uniref:hypothetical protein n=1 Tax=Streptomyces sp. SID161 TaxID=2690251 RepID=UPI0013FA44F2|nr:hypothetical protein [Streptomyces sp. SID161]MYW49610.1 hypothetical protein [Streptomyces sp. SID161]
MTCEDNHSRLTWEVQLYEPFSKVWMCRGLGRATTNASPADIARGVLAGYLAANPPRGGETFRAIARPDTGQPATVTADQLRNDGWTAGPDVRQALPVYLREALAQTG